MKNDELLHKWVNGELTEAETEAFKQRPEYASLLRLREYTDRMQAPKLEEAPMLQKILHSPKGKVRQLHRRWLVAAAAIGLVLAAWILLQPPATTQFTADAGERIKEQLPDASIVVLNASSTISFSEKNWSDNRQLKLTGEAYFDVATGSTFTVNTEVGQVEVLGTQFNVWSRGDQLEVSCYEGRVAVRFATNSFDTIIQAGQAIRLQANQVAEYWTVNSEQLRDHLPTNGQVRLNAVPLSRAVAELERQFDIQIKTNNVDLTETVTTTFPADNLQEALQLLERVVPIRSEIVSSEQVNLFQKTADD